MTKPLVSIITPCHNGEAFLKRYFESILNQTYPNLELIFINDGSTDRTEEIALSYRERLEKRGITYIYEKQENAGQAAALNRGLKLFTGEYLTWPDSDDVMVSDAVEKKVDYLEQHPDYGFCICKTKVVNENNPEMKCGYYERMKPEGEDHLFEDILFLKNIYFAPGAYMVRSEELLEVLPDREIYTGKGGQNAQVLLPMAYSYKCGYMDDILYLYYIREESHSHSITDSKKVIQQLEYYETILLETLKKMGNDIYEKYEGKIKCFYAARKFGNAVDTRDREFIRKEYLEMQKQNFYIPFKTKLLYIKSTNRILKSIVDKVKGR